MPMSKSTGNVTLDSLADALQHLETGNLYFFLPVLAIARSQQ